MTIEVGDKVILIPDGKGGYLAQKITIPQVGDKVILIPDGRGGFAATKSITPLVGDKVITMNTNRGRIILHTLPYTTIGTLISWEPLAYQEITPGNPTTLYTENESGVSIVCWQDTWYYRGIFGRGWYARIPPLNEYVTINGYTYKIRYGGFVGRPSGIVHYYLNYEVGGISETHPAGSTVYIHTGYFRIITSISVYSDPPVVWDGMKFKITNEKFQCTYADTFKGTQYGNKWGIEFYIENDNRALEGTTKTRHQYGESVQIQT
jgi:hypothetical protein